MSRPDTKAIRARVAREDDNGYEFFEAARDDVRALCDRVEALEAALHDIEAVNDPLPAAVRSIARAALEGE